MHLIPLTTISCGAPTDEGLAFHRRQCDGLLHQTVEQESARARSPSVEPKRELVQIVVQMFGTDGTLVGTQQPSLEQGSDAVGPGEQVISQAGGWSDYFVLRSQRPQSSITRPVVCLNARARLDRLLHRRLQAGCRSIRDPRQANSAYLGTIGLSGNEYQGLADGPAAPLTGARASEESLIDFDHSGQSIPARSNHRPPQLVHPVPCCPITAQAKNPLDAQGTGARLLISDVPDCFKPKSQGFVRVCEQRAHSDGEIIAALRTAVERGLHRPYLSGRAMGTTRAIRPTQTNQVLATGFLRGKPVAEFHHRLWVVGHALGTLPVGVRGIKCIALFSN